MVNTYCIAASSDHAMGKKRGYISYVGQVRKGQTERQANQEREHLQGNEGEGDIKERHRQWYVSPPSSNSYAGE
jgi:hypothetical protein